MSNDRRFDEVMIVNPCDPVNAAGEGARVMQFHYAQPLGYGYYAGPSDFGYYAEPAGYGYWGETDPYHMSDYGDYQPVGYAADPGYGDYYQPVGYYAEPPAHEWGAPDTVEGYDDGAYEPLHGDADSLGYDPNQSVGYYADEYPVQYHGISPEMVGWGEYADAGYAAPDLDGYVREVPAAYNPGCPMPTNVAGFGEPVEGYVRPRDVNPTCENFTPQPGATPGVPDTFRPLW